MKKITPLLMVGMLVLSGLGAVAFSNEEDIIREEYIEEINIEISDAIIEKTGEFITVDFEESTSILMRTGKPIIPVITKTLTFEPGTYIEDINVQIDWEQIDLSSKIMPTPGVLPQTIEKTRYEDELGTIDELVYSSTDLYPSEPYTITKRAGLKDDKHVTFVNIRCNAQYSPANYYINVPKNIDINIKYNEPETASFTADEYDLLIITHSKFEEDLQPLVTHKNSKGMRTMMETVDYIYDEYEGVADWEEVKLYIADMVETYGISFVLLAGGHKGQTNDWWVPVFESHNWNPLDAYDPPYDETFTTDLYFADVFYLNQYGFHVFDDWDTNNNGIYGEGPDLYPGGGTYDIPDMVPDVHLGRIPLRYSWEVPIVVDKIVDYENNADDSWFKRALMCGGDGFPTERYPGVATPGIYEGEIVCDVIAGLLLNKDVISTKAYCSEEGDLLVTSLHDIVPEMTKGYGFVHMTGHASPFSLGSYYPNVLPLIDFYNWFNLRKYDNDGKLPFMVAEGCHNAQIDVTTQQLIDLILTDYSYPVSRSEWIPHDASSQLVIQPGGGCIAVIGNTGLGLGGINNWCTKVVGGKMNINFFNAYATAEIRQLVGDPSVKLGGYGSLSNEEPEEDNAEPTVESTIVLAPTWQTGDSWTYQLDNVDFAISEVEDRSVDIELSAGDIKVEIVEITSDEYIAEISSDNIDISFEMDFDLMIEEMEPIVIPPMSFQNIYLNGQMFFDKETLGIKKVEITLGLELMENLDSLPIELPAIVEKLTFVTIPVEIDLTIDFENPFEFFMQFPLEDDNHWGFEENVFTVSIDGKIDSVWLRILHFINKIIPIIPEQFAQFLPVVDISEVLESFGIPSEFEIDFPVNLDHYKATNFFQVNGNENVNTKGGTYNCKKISVLDDNANFYYCQDAKNVVRLCGKLSEYIPILEDINLELVETNTI